MNTNNISIVKNFDFEDSKPTKINDFIGQEDVTNNLKIFIDKNINNKNTSLKRVLLFGPYGIGKKTIANIIASELNKNIITIASEDFSKDQIDNISEDNIVLLTNIDKLSNKHLEFLINRINTSLKTKIIIATACSIKRVSDELRDRFDLCLKFNFYSEDETKEIILKYAENKHEKISDDAALSIAEASRGVPNTALTYYENIKKFFNRNINITKDCVETALYYLKINNKGISQQDYSLMNIIHNLFNNGPINLTTLAATMGVNPRIIENDYEPFLLRRGYIIKIKKGRCLTDKGLQLIQEI